MEATRTTERMNTMDTTITDYYDYLNDTQPCDTNVSLLNPAVMTVIFYLVFVLGLLGNSMVLWVLLKVMRLKTMTDVCLLNLALSDLLIVLSLPWWALYNQGYHFGAHAVCKAMAGAYNLGFYSGILFVTLMSVDRYLAIVHAVSTMGARTLRYGAAVSLVIWIISFCAALPEAIFAGMTFDNNVTQCSKIYPSKQVKAWKLFRNFSENTVGLFISLPITVYCYIQILLVLRRMKNSKKGRAMKLIFTIVAAFVTFWVPYNVVVFLQTLQHLDVIDTCNGIRWITAALGLTETLALVHCCVNPVIYAFVGEKFRKCLAGMVSKYLFKVYQPTPIHSKTSDETSNTIL
uniref:Si:cabz01093077.1 n=1 Tax=Astyanax mexicanus TaxID=7994 RepID=A0A3B1JXK8_ASTMX